MSEGILVGGSESRTLAILARIFAPILGVVGLWFALGLGWPVAGLAMAAVAGAGWIAIELLTFFRLKARRWVVDLGNGFQWSGGPEEFAVGDHQVCGIRLVHERKFSEGLLKRIDRRFEVWIEGRAEPIVMLNAIPVDTRDPLEAMIDRICEQFKCRTAAELASGAVLVGDDWNLSRQGLAVRDARGEAIIPFSEIEKVGYFDGKLCVWRHGQDEPAVQIRPDSINAPIVTQLLSEWVQNRPEEEAPPVALAAGGDGQPGSPGGSGLGRILFQRSQRNARNVLVVLAIVAAVAGGFMLLGHETRLFGGLVILLAPLFAAGAWYWNENIFRCHELGIYHKFSRNGERRLPFTDITEFTYQATRVFVNGAYTGTQLAVKFRSPSGDVNYSANVKSADEDLDELRDHVANVLAGRMLCEVQAGQSIAWAGDMVLTPQGLVYRPAGFFGSKPEQLLPYAQIRGWSMDKGVLFIWDHVNKDPVVRKQVSAANFFPGFYALTALCQGVQSSES
jgi:hypothetical protein